MYNTAIYGYDRAWNCWADSFKYDPFGHRIYKSSSAGTSIYAYNVRKPDRRNERDRRSRCSLHADDGQDRRACGRGCAARHAPQQPGNQASLSVGNGRASSARSE